MHLFFRGLCIGCVTITLMASFCRMPAINATVLTLTPPNLTLSNSPEAYFSEPHCMLGERPICQRPASQHQAGIRSWSLAYFAHSLFLVLLEIRTPWSYLQPHAFVVAETHSGSNMLEKFELQNIYRLPRTIYIMHNEFSDFAFCWLSFRI